MQLRLPANLNGYSIQILFKFHLQATHTHTLVNITNFLDAYFEYFSSEFQCQYRLMGPGMPGDQVFISLAF